MIQDKHLRDGESYWVHMVGFHIAGQCGIFRYEQRRWFGFESSKQPTFKCHTIDCFVVEHVARPSARRVDSVIRKALRRKPQI